MRRSRSALLFFACPLTVVVVAACGTTGTIDTAPTTPERRLALGTNDVRNVLTVTDLDETRDVARAELRVYVATDRGVLVYPATGDGAPRRYTAADGLPSDDVRALAVDPSGAAIVATPEGLGRVGGDGASRMGATPPVGEIRALHVAEDRTGWACGSDGLAKTDEGQWKRFATGVACTGMWPDGDELWVGTTAGLWRIEEGAIVREHGTTEGLPETYVRDLLPLGEGRLLTLLQGPTETRIGFWDGVRWFGYTIDGFERKAVALTPHPDGAVLLTEGAAFLVSRLQAPGAIQLDALSASDPGGVRSWRARLLTPTDLAESEPEAPSDPGLKTPSRLASVPENAPTIEAPPFVVVPLPAVRVPRRLEWVRRDGNGVYMAVTNAGVIERLPDQADRYLRSRDLITERDFQIAVDRTGETVVLGQDGQLAEWNGTRFVRVDPPEGAVQAITSGPDGAYVLTRRGDDEPATLTLYRRATDGWSPVLERFVDIPETFVGAPFMTVGQDGRVWAGLRIEERERTRMRGAMLLDPSAEAVVYLHRGATAEADGEGAVSMPDEVEAVTTTNGRDVWFASLSGAIRVVGDRAEVFGEAKGVRGEVVTDVLLGLNDRIWLAAAEGLGYWDGGSFDFPVVGEARSARPARITLDAEGNVWGAGSRGVLTGTEGSFRALGVNDGLPTADFLDIEADGRDRLWLMAPDRVLILTREAADAATP